MIVLDTHAWVWWTSDPDKLSSAAQAELDAAAAVGVSTLSVWEVAMLGERGRVTFDVPVRRWIAEALRVDRRLRAIAPSVDVAVRAALFEAEGMRGDPADRFILATALSEGGRLVTRNEKLRAFAPATTVW